MLEEIGFVIGTDRDDDVSVRRDFIEEIAGFYAGIHTGTIPI